MTGYPIAWDYEAADALPDADARGPYSAAEMTKYLIGCHYHYSVDEPLLQLGEPMFRAELDTRDRHFWLWQVGDQSGRTWNLIVGTGKSPFHNDDRHCHRWIYADEAEKEDPARILARASSQHSP